MKFDILSARLPNTEDLVPLQAAELPPEILDLPHLPKMHFYPIFRHKNAFLPPVLAKKNLKKT